MRPVQVLLLAALLVPGVARALDLPVRDPRREALVEPAYVADRFEVRLAPAAALRARRVRPLAAAPAEAVVPRLDVAAVDAVAAGLGVTFEPEFRGERSPEPGSGEPDFTAFYIAHLPEGLDLESALARFRALPEVLSADPIAVLPVSAVPGDSLWSISYWYDPLQGTSIHGPEAWDVTTGDSTVTVAVLDTGVIPYHPDLGGAVAGLAGNIWTNWAEKGGLLDVDDDGNGFVDDTWGWDFVARPSGSGIPIFEDWRNADNDPNDYAGHGTFVAGLVGALSDNVIGVTGAAWKVRLMPLRMAWATNSSPLGVVDMSYAAQAVRYATRMGARVINCSFASLDQSGLGVALDAATRAGVVVVAAAGNNGQPSYIGTRLDVVAVGAIAANGYIPSFSNLGTWVDLVAPGMSITSTYVRFPPTSSDSIGYRQPAYNSTPLNGTSFSAPLAAGTVALLQARQRDLGRRLLQPMGAVLRLRETTDDCSALNHFTGYGTGSLNAYRALTDRPTSTAWRSGAATVGPALPIPLAGPARRVAYVTSDAHLLMTDWLTGDTLALTALPGPPARQLAAADLGGGHGIGLFVGTTSGGLAGFDTTGTALPGFPVSIPGGASLVGGPALGDLDGDGVLEIVCGAADGALWAWRAGGSVVAGFPAATNASGIATPVALSDLDGEPGVEIIAATVDGKAYAVRGTGAVLGGWPANVNPTPFAPVVTRFGRDTVVLVAGGGQVVALRPDGSERSRLGLSGTAATDPALGDLNGDGTDEVVVASTALNEVDVVDSSGANLLAQGWPYDLTSAPDGPPVIGHLEGGGPQGVVIMQGGALLALNDTAATVGPFPKPGGAGAWPTLADLADDGASKVLAGSGVDSSLYVYDGGAASASGTPQAWPTPRGNPARTGSHLYLSPDALPPAAVTDLQARFVPPDSVCLVWTAPGDDGVVGRAAAYDVRRTSFKAFAGRFDVGTPSEAAPAPDSAGGSESWGVGRLSAGVTTWFWLRTRDAAGNLSRGSNLVGFTRPLGTARVAGMALAVRQRPTGLPVALDWQGTGAESIRFYDVSGRLVRTLRPGRGEAGTVQWNGRDESGRLVPAGVYFARLSCGSLHAQTRVVLLP